ncbi:MAG: signal peptidase II [Lachnospiraceae bacterium]|nr:signal peptidase II [Candidatus Equihabitans merdae]
MALLAGGAIGNLIDRVFLGSVRDFIYFKLINFPVFNVADIAVTCSAFILVYLVLIYYKDEDFAFLNLKAKDQKHE